MSNQVSKGLRAIRLSNRKPEKHIMGGDVFYFKRLTIAMEEELDDLVRSGQDDNLAMPEAPIVGEDGNMDPVELKEYDKKLAEFMRGTNRVFRRITAEIMKYVLVDETGAPFFSEADTVDNIFEQLDNVYAENFFKAYQKFRGMGEANVANAETRFQK